jgi:hypothetical protein
LGGRFINDSGASRGEIAKPRLDLFLVFEKFEVDVCAKRSLTWPHETRPSCPDLIPASIINLRHKFLRRRWITGSRPGNDDLNWYTVIAKGEAKPTPSCPA